MAVFRIEKTKDYTVMANHHLKNKELTLKAKGLLSIMLSLPDSWNYTTRGLAAICKEGVDSIGSALKELEAAGYIIRNRLRDAKGRITDTEYVIYETPEHRLDATTPDTEEPCTENPDMDNADTDEPDLGQPNTENPAQLNTYRVNIHQEKKQPSNTVAFNPYQSNPYQSILQPVPISTDVSRTRARVKLNIDYECIVTPFNRQSLDEIVEIMVETLCGKTDTISVAGEQYPAALVKERLLKINSLHIEYIFDCLAQNARPIRNIKKYLLATLFNAPITLSSYYDAKVRHDRQCVGSWMDRMEDAIE